MSAHTPIIKSIIESCGYKSYLELGIYDGKNFLECSETCDFAVAVDRTLPNNVRDQTDKRRSFQCTTEEFFQFEVYSLQPKQMTFDAIFIDACHDFKYVLNDFHDSWARLKPNGVIFLHDTDPQEEKLLDSGYCGDAYKIHTTLKNMCCTYVTIPCAEAGLTIVKHDKHLRHLAFTSKPVLDSTIALA